MGFNKYPYTDLHEMNLDWIIARTKELIAKWAETSAAWLTQQEAFESLKNFVNNYFDNLDVQQEINNKIDDLVEDGTLSDLIAPYVASGLPAVVADQISAVVAAQISAVVASQLPDEVADQLPAIAASAAAAEVGTWLETHVDPETGYVIDNSLTIPLAAADAEVTGNALRGLENGLPLYPNAYYVSGGIGSTGAKTSVNTRIRNNDKGLVLIDSGDYYFCDSLYKVRIGIYNENSIDEDEFVGFVGDDYANGLIPIPATYAGKYAAVSIEKTDHESDNISSEVSSIKEHVKYFSPSKGLGNLRDFDDFSFESGNNVIPFTGEFLYNDGNILVKIYRGIVTIKGRLSSISGRTLRIKVTNGFDYVVDEVDKADWKNDTLSVFESGEVYSIHNLVLSGEMPSSSGSILRDTDGNIILSKSIPQAEIVTTPSYVTVAVQRATEIDVSFIPVYVKGVLSDLAYLRELNEYYKIPGIKYHSMPDLSASYVWDNDLQYAIKLPSGYKRTGDKTPMVIICHGLSSTIDASTWGGTALTNIVNRFAQEGYAVLDVNQVTTADWCNPDLIKRYVNAIADAEDRYNVKATYIYGYSMGSLITLVLASLYGIKASVISGLRLDLAARYAEMDSATKAIVDSNLGFTDGYDAYECSGWNKTAYEIGEASAPVNPNQFPPTWFMWGSSDTLTTTESIERAKAVKRGGTIGEIKEYAGDHAALCALTASGTMDDCLAWFSTWK